jgi:hypothetical protein
MLRVIGSKPGQINRFFPAAAMLLFYINKKLFSKVLYFPKIYDIASLYGPIPSGASVDPATQVLSPAMLVLPIVGN